jgi:5-methylthioadenosine/S-adenosylhomocysteine deaminase
LTFFYFDNDRRREKSMKCDLLIMNCRLFDPSAARTVGRDSGYFAVSGGVIVAMGDKRDAAEKITAARTLDASGGLVMPGLVNCHCHAAMSLFRGLADDLPLMSWLNDHVFPAEAQFVRKEMVYWCTKLAAAEMLLSGTTTVADSYFYEGEAAQAFHDSGMRAVAAQGVIDFPAPGVPDPAANIFAAEEFIEAWQEKESLVQPAVFCHSPYTCSPETLKRAKELAVRKDVLFFIHLSETATEKQLIHERHGTSPVRHLFELGVLDERTVCVHCVWLDQKDIDLLAESKAKVVTCPESNMKLASGTAPVPAMLAGGISVGLGTDGCASNNDLDLFGEMNMLAKLHKLSRMDPTILPASQVLRMATADGAKLLSMPKGCGRLQVGSPADCIVLNVHKPHYVPFYNPNILVYAGRGSDVDHVIINGKVVVHGGRIVSFDLEEVQKKVLELAQAVKKFAR